MSRLISKYLWRVLGFFAFNRIAVIHAERLPDTGPVLFIATHRNGAMDAAPYYKATPEVLTLVSIQLQRGWLGRLLFPGISVARDKDRERGMQTDNQAALDEAVRHLAAGGQLLIFPEGTSSLGPRHLPFKKGAARIAQRALEQNIPLAVVPLAVHYESPTEWQSRVEVLVGLPVLLTGTAQNTVAHLHAEFTAALEAVGVNADSTDSYTRLAKLAYCATLGTETTYSDALKRVENGLTDDIQDTCLSVEQMIDRTRPALHQGIPLFPVGSSKAYAFYWLFLTPWIIIAAALNAPVIGAAVWASRTLPDDENVIAFWRMLVGAPVALLWSCGMTATLLSTGHVLSALLYGCCSLAGVRVFYRWKKLSIALYNRWQHPDLAAPLFTYYGKILAFIKQGGENAAQAGG